jgi:uncharacterized membrane protein
VLSNVGTTGTGQLQQLCSGGGLLAELVEDEVELQVSIHNSVISHNTVGDVSIALCVLTARTRQQPQHTQHDQVTQAVLEPLALCSFNGRGGEWGVCVPELVEDEVELAVSIHNSVVTHNTVGGFAYLILLHMTKQQHAQGTRALLQLLAMCSFNICVVEVWVFVLLLCAELVEDEVELQVPIHNSAITHNTVGGV